MSSSVIPSCRSTSRPGSSLPNSPLIIAPYDALLIRSSTTVTREIIEHADSLKVIGRAGVGIDNVDLEAATRRGIVVMNSPHGNSVTTAEHAISMMMACARKIPVASASSEGRQMGPQELHRRRGMRQGARRRRPRQHRQDRRRSRAGPEDEGDRLRSDHDPRGRRSPRHRAGRPRRDFPPLRFHHRAHAAHR